MRAIDGGRQDLNRVRREQCRCLMSTGVTGRGMKHLRRTAAVVRHRRGVQCNRHRGPARMHVHGVRQTRDKQRKHAQNGDPRTHGRHVTRRSGLEKGNRHELTHSSPDVRAGACRNTMLIPVMPVDNAAGTIEPIAEIGAIAGEHGSRGHTASAQTIGRIATNIASLDIDLFTSAGHELGAPKAAAALHVRCVVRLDCPIHGGGHKGGRRAGTTHQL